MTNKVALSEYIERTFLNSNDSSELIVLNRFLPVKTSVNINLKTLMHENPLSLQKLHCLRSIPILLTLKNLFIVVLNFSLLSGIIEFIRNIPFVVLFLGQFYYTKKECFFVLLIENRGFRDDFYLRKLSYL